TDEVYGSLQPEDKLLESQPRLNLKLQDVTVTVTSLANTEARKNERIESMLGYPDAGEFNGKDLDIPKLLDASEPYGQQSVAGARHTLKVKVRRLRLQANGIIHARQAAASSCLLVMLLGAVMSTLLRRQVPLVVFFWCFLPTILAFLSINEGTKILQMYGVSQTTGYAVLWSGNGLLVLLILIGSRMLRRR
ncbi:MAG: hypothetical protein R3236_10665, partial [Phycisphaeraceae bacterium]|nr:hypothetical protein [Phycisphaeraceae bacterium]